MNIGKEYGFFLQVIIFWEININIRKEDILKPAYFYRPLIWVLCLDCEDVQLDLSTQGHHTLAYNLQSTIGRSLRSCRKSVLERHQKSDDSQGEKNIFFFLPS